MCAPVPKESQNRQQSKQKIGNPHDEWREKTGKNILTLM